MPQDSAHRWFSQECFRVDIHGLTWPHLPSHRKTGVSLVQPGVLGARICSFPSSDNGLLSTAIRFLMGMIYNPILTTTSHSVAKRTSFSTLSHRLDLHKTACILCIKLYFTYHKHPSSHACIQSWSLKTSTFTPSQRPVTLPRLRRRVFTSQAGPWQQDQGPHGPSSCHRA